MNFAQTAKKSTQTKLTENGAKAYNTSGQGALLDFFALAGSLRSRQAYEIEDKFASAFAENPLYATKALFYIGDIRNGGLGERRTFQICLKWLAKNHPQIVRKNLEYIAYFNRFDSLFNLVDTLVESEMWKFYKTQLQKDWAAMKAGKPVSLAAKWAPSENASSKKTKRLAKRAIEHMELTPRGYRKILSTLREYLKVTEVSMSSQNWHEINYEAVPSKAMSNYNRAFGKHDYERFNAFIHQVKAGEKKINASTLFPYDLVRQVWNGTSNDVTEEQWKALPNYVEGEKSFLVMADVSGSMYGRPIETSIGLATYFAERNKGVWHNLYMTFSEKPSFINLDGYHSLESKVEYVRRKGVGYSTNLEAAFDKVLSHALQHNLAQEDMPEALIVISDNEINPFFGISTYWGSRNYTLDFVDTMKVKFAAAGYKMPKLIMWNVEARNDTFLSQSSDVLLVSGQSASVFKQLMGDLNGVTAYQLMMETLNRKVYDCITI